MIRTSDGKDITRNIKHVKPHLKPQAGGPHHPRSPDPELDRGHQRSTPDSEARRPEVQGPAGGGEEGARRSSRLAGRERPNYAEVVRGRVQQVRWLPSTHTSSTSAKSDSRSSTTPKLAANGQQIPQWLKDLETKRKYLQQQAAESSKYSPDITTGRSGRWWISPRCQSCSPGILRAQAAQGRQGNQEGRGGPPVGGHQGRAIERHFASWLEATLRAEAADTRAEVRAQHRQKVQQLRNLHGGGKRVLGSGGLAEVLSDSENRPAGRAGSRDTPGKSAGSKRARTRSSSSIDWRPWKETEKNATVRRKGGDPEEEKGESEEE